MTSFSSIFLGLAFALPAALPALAQPANDNFANRILLEGYSARASGSNARAPAILERYASANL